jgi:hypothetical protein
LIGVALTALKEQASSHPGRPSTGGRVFLNSNNRPVEKHRDWFDTIIGESGLDAYCW